MFFVVARAPEAFHEGVPLLGELRVFALKHAGNLTNTPVYYFSQWCLWPSCHANSVHVQITFQQMFLSSIPVASAECASLRHIVAKSSC